VVESTYWSGIAPEAGLVAGDIAGGELSWLWPRAMSLAEDSCAKKFSASSPPVLFKYPLSTIESSALSFMAFSNSSGDSVCSLLTSQSRASEAVMSLG
jgi:hypothetical protein